MDESAPQKIDAITKDMVESTVITWLNGYALDGSNLSIQNYEDKEEIKKWVRGVWGRIKHQLEDSGFPFPGGKIMNLAGFYFHDQIKNHPRYEALKPHLPPEVLLYDGL
ncbi:MAG: hypothetical protein KBD05_01125 [Candidatus Pacebacteria bacterium]|nr:hypothetical protein [Candidatus Paceibacterota bacterium]